MGQPYSLVAVTPASHAAINAVNIRKIVLMISSVYPKVISFIKS